MPCWFIPKNWIRRILVHLKSLKTIIHQIPATDPQTMQDHISWWQTFDTKHRLSTMWHTPEYKAMPGHRLISLLFHAILKLTILLSVFWLQRVFVWWYDSYYEGRAPPALACFSNDNAGSKTKQIVRQDHFPAHHPITKLTRRWSTPGQSEVGSTWRWQHARTSLLPLCQQSTTALIAAIIILPF